MGQGGGGGTRTCTCTCTCTFRRPPPSPPAQEEARLLGNTAAAKGRAEEWEARRLASHLVGRWQGWEARSQAQGQAAELEAAQKALAEGREPPLDLGATVFYVQVRQQRCVGMCRAV